MGAPPTWSGGGELEVHRLGFPGTSPVAHLDENVGALEVELSEAEVERLDAAAG